MKNTRRDKYKLGMSMRLFLLWPIVFTLIAVIAGANVYTISRKAGIVCIIEVILFAVFSFAIYFLHRRIIYSDLIEFAQNFGELQHSIIYEMNQPFAILSGEGHMLWSNDECQKILSSKKAAKRNISNVFPDITSDKFPKVGQDGVFSETLGDTTYRIELRRVNATRFKHEKDEKLLPLDRMISLESVVLMFIYDDTQVEALRKKAEEENLLVGFLYIDNYEETFSNSDDVAQTLSLAVTERRINSFMNSIDAIYKKFEKDKYLFVFRQKYLRGIEDEHFKILEKVRDGINGTNAGKCTISIGIGTGNDTFEERCNKARAAIDLALGRGGDQAVIKNEDSEQFFGGKSVQVERTTRVKARVKAHALKELMESKSRVVVMGHAMGDLDSFGACVGIYKIAKVLDRKAYIVLDDCSTSVYPIRDSFAGSSYDSDMIIDSRQAKNLVDEDTVLVVVDVNKADHTQCPELLGMTQSIVVIDHHRQAGDAIDNAILFYIEPYASSACEMVAEISQYINSGVKLTVEEANALYAGIMIDTNYFTNKTGVRTFETMAFLKRNGADTVKLRKMFRESLDDYKLKAAAIQNTKIYGNGFAIAVSDPEDSDDPTVLGAKVANSLLDINGVRASFVLTDINGKIYISARAIDEVNVQVMMEKIGGGGHINVAGAQIEGKTTDEVIEIIKKLADEEMEEES